MQWAQPPCQLLNKLVIGIAQRAIDVETQGLYAGFVESHDGLAQVQDSQDDAEQAQAEAGGNSNGQAGENKLGGRLRHLARL
jgi:hypothetical protein